MKLFPLLFSLITSSLAMPGDTWAEYGRAMVGTSDNRGVGEQLLFPNSKVLLEAHHVDWPTNRMKGYYSASALEVTVYVYEEALYDWIPFGPPLKRSFAPGYDFATGRVVIQSSDRHPQSSHLVTVLETYEKFDEQDPDKMTGCHARIQTYNLYAGQWLESAVMETPAEKSDCERDGWGQDIALSKNQTLAVGSSSADGGYIQLYTMVEDPFYQNQWEPLDPPLKGDAPFFGFAVKMSNDGDVVLSQGCRGESMDDPDCFVRAFHQEKGTWTQMGSDIAPKDLELQPGDSFEIESETGRTFVLGTHDNDPSCPHSRLGGHVRVFEYSESAKDWIQKGQDLDDLMDFSGAASVIVGAPLAIGNKGNRVVVSVYWQDKILGENNFFQTFNFDESSNEWVLEGPPFHVDALATAAALTPDGNELVVGSMFGTYFMGNLQTLKYHGDDDVDPQVNRQVETVTMQKKWREKRDTNWQRAPLHRHFATAHHLPDQGLRGTAGTSEN